MSMALWRSSSTLRRRTRISRSPPTMASFSGKTATSVTVRSSTKRCTKFPSSRASSDERYRSEADAEAAPQEHRGYECCEEIPGDPMEPDTCKRQGRGRISNLDALHRALGRALLGRVQDPRAERTDALSREPDEVRACLQRLVVHGARKSV